MERTETNGPTIRAGEELRGLEACLEDLAELKRALGGRLAEVAPAVSAWSCAQHLYHLALATDLALRNVASLQTGKGLLIVHEGGPTELAVRVLREGTYPRGQSEAPRMVRPPDEVDAEFLEAEMRGNREALRALIEREGELTAGEGRVPHQVLGALNALEWLRFARLHALHHLAIARDVQSSLA